MASAVDSVLSKARKAGASDVHIAVGSPITFRIHGELTPQGKQKVTAAQADRYVRSLLGQTRYKDFKANKEIDVSYSLPSGVRFRVNCHYERGSAGFVARVIPTEIPPLEDLGIPEITHELCGLTEGLVLFTGPTGHGKSTSMAAMLQKIREDRAVHIVTLEDPIEFIFPKGSGIIRQREYGIDFLSFPEGLKRVLRQDPNIIMVGEMRDPETIATALTLAETGHLVFATLHTPNTIQTVDRIIDVFQPHQQRQVRVQLSMSLKAVISQRLLPKEGGGRALQCEVLLNTPAVGNIIRDQRVHELKSVIQTSTNIGMCTFERDAKRLLKEGSISKETYEWAKL